MTDGFTTDSTIGQGTVDLSAGMFNFSFAPGVSAQQMAGIQAAGHMWSDKLADDISVNIYVAITDQLPENVIGGALPGFIDDISYEDFRLAIRSDITSTSDKLAYYSLGGDYSYDYWEKEAAVTNNSKYFDAILRGLSKWH